MFTLRRLAIAGLSLLVCSSTFLVSSPNWTVAGTSSQHTRASGRLPGHAHGVAIQQRCGWHITPLPRTTHGRLLSIASISQPPDGGAWAIGHASNSKSVVLHWTGRRWLAFHPKTNTGMDVILALSKTNVWFAGSVHIKHWDGRRISVFSNPLGGYIQQLVGTRANSIWLLSYSDENTYLEHWNGLRWLQAKPPGGFGTEPWQGISADGEKDLWAVGGYPADGSGDVGHWNGSRWRYVRSPIITNTLGVLDLGPKDVWTAGYNKIDHFNGSKWRVTPSPEPWGAPVFYSLPVVAGLRHGGVYVAGASRKSKGLLLRWTGHRWAHIRTPLPKYSSYFDTLAIDRHGDVWVAGESFHGRLSRNLRPLIEHYVKCV